MQHLIIRNVGPIKHVDINLNKFNIIMGPQSSGKSTIIKIACFCRWVEKRAIMDGVTILSGNVFNEGLVDFHKLNGYFSDDSYFKYESDYVTVIFQGKFSVTIQDFSSYVRNKVAYIPAERNIVASIPNWFDVKLPNNNIRSFMADWETARKFHTKDNALTIPSLGTSYYYDRANKTDYMCITEGKTLEFTNTSSGLQSVTPLVTLVDYFTKGIYENDTEASISELTQRKRLGDIQLSNLFIEEPEQNLFPLTQRDLLYFLLKSVSGERNHSLFLTTHSPYILNALNNCMMGGLIQDSINRADKERLLSSGSWISPDCVSAWQIENGELVDIKSSRLGTIGEHYFNQSMNEILNEYYVMLKYIKRENYAE